MSLLSISIASPVFDVAEPPVAVLAAGSSSLLLPLSQAAAAARRITKYVLRITARILARPIRLRSLHVRRSPNGRDVSDAGSRGSSPRGLPGVPARRRTSAAASIAGPV